MLSGRRDKFKQQILEMSFIHRHPELASGPVTKFSADFDLSRQGDDREPVISNTGVEGFVDVAWVTGSERTEYDEDLSRRVGAEVTACLD